MEVRFLGFRSFLVCWYTRLVVQAVTNGLRLKRPQKAEGAGKEQPSKTENFQTITALLLTTEETQTIQASKG